MEGLRLRWEQTMSIRGPRYLHLMADHGSAGIWDHDGTSFDPAKSPLSQKLRQLAVALLRTVREIFEAETDLKAFAAVGRTIAHATKAELLLWLVFNLDEAEVARAGCRGVRAAYEIEV